MKLHFYLYYRTNFGESLLVSINGEQAQELEYLNDEVWEGHVDLDTKGLKTLHWQYLFKGADGAIVPEYDVDRSIDLDACNQQELYITDQWNDIGALENVFFTQAFNPAHQATSSTKNRKKSGTIRFRVKAPLLKQDEVVCLLGHGKALRNWDTIAPLLLEKQGNWWELDVDLSDESFPLGYKYGVWHQRLKRFLGFEDGSNRSILHHIDSNKGISGLKHDGFLRIPYNTWRGAGVSIPVFSLRSENGWGIGEFTDIPHLATWAKSVELKMIQLLPINDTSSTLSWQDSYPYAPISVFALHPIYLNLDELAGKKYASILKPFLKDKKALNNLESIDYEAVLNVKWKIIDKIYTTEKESWQKDPDWQDYYKANKHWLDHYAVFCFLRDKNGSAAFDTWPKYATFKSAEIDKLINTPGADQDRIQLHQFVQWQLHRQLKAAVDFTHSLGIALKGDLPIGIYRNSVDAWVAPDLFNMNAQAGAPPDPFAEKGQNWGFPTYNWDQMKADGYAWWRQRFEQMSHYFDAFRIDHILGFFRIWSIPMDAVEGILGRFEPAIPLTEEELWNNGIGFSYDRLCKPYITDQVLFDLFQDKASAVKRKFLSARGDGQYDLLPKFDTQRKVAAHFASSKTDTDLQQGLFDLIANVVLLGEDPASEQKWQGAFRFDMEKTLSFQHLPEEVKSPLKRLYIDYFYRRQDDFWENQAMEKLPALKRSTNMLICGEDLGLVPACVPGVMERLALLSLEIQRMPKSTESTFLNTRTCPYLSVITPGTHDMSVIRGWWEEDRNLSQRFYNEILGQQGQAPYFCEDWIVREILKQHFQAPSMWAIFQLQDLLGLDASLRRENPHDERINIPANPKHYWRYRSHITLEQLQQADGFNRSIRNMTRESGRS